MKKLCFFLRKILFATYKENIWYGEEDFYSSKIELQEPCEKIDID